MLQAVVADDHVDVRMRGAQRLRGRDAIRADPDGRTGAACDQERFVAARAGARRGCDGGRRLHVRTVAARHDAGREAGRAQRVDECDHGRRLAGAADGHVADHDDGHADVDRLLPALRVGGAPQRRAYAEHARERRERHASAAALPFARQAGFEPGERAVGRAHRAGRGISCAAAWDGFVKADSPLGGACRGSAEGGTLARRGRARQARPAAAARGAGSRRLVDNSVKNSLLDGLKRPPGGLRIG